MKKRDESIPLAPSMSPIQGKKQVQVPGMVDKRVFYLSIQAIINALVIGAIAKVLVYLIDLITNIAFYGKFSFEGAGPAENSLGIAVIAVPIVGSIIVGLLAKYGSAAIRGHGIPEAMEKIILDESKIPPLITLLKPLSAAISIGTGGPFGAEGPIIATGGAFGSFTGQIMHISAAERKIMLSAGACAVWPPFSAARWRLCCWLLSCCFLSSPPGQLFLWPWPVLPARACTFCCLAMSRYLPWALLPPLPTAR
jgi:hypothetical protein